MKKIMMVVFMFCVAVLSGCMYPQERLQQNQIPYPDQLQIVQGAVNQYKEANGGLLPIKTREMDTPLYQKYPIEFTKLSPRFMPEPPSNAFENGGIYQYVLIDAETNPTVKLIDLRIAEEIRDLKLKIKMYRDEHKYPPFKKVIADGVYTLDYQKLKYKEEPFVESPYSGKNLPFVIDAQGEVYVDYRIDLYEILRKNVVTMQEGQDIRFLLTEKSPFVPAYSLPYTIKDNEPIFFVQ
ncbi:hypothetical protein P6P90_01955 [Ectobacillus antri]|uniref:ABC transporter periplasmic binding protein yphF n=1 Tax=Ectobacillus antri TaxID=2486280 RepID=A0ABT6H2A6_9BACI|nr:hypothetical protein [Ectobacillus antri]MDG4656090.1 hypothetical protein [Ectobacillus antri]MDG5752765.1 hypothetical protein [Ectobacillus antri]